MYTTLLGSLLFKAYYISITNKQQFASHSAGQTICFTDIIISVTTAKEPKEATGSLLKKRVSHRTVCPCLKAGFKPPACCPPDDRSLALRLLTLSYHIGFFLFLFKKIFLILSHRFLLESKVENMKALFAFFYI